MALGALLFSFLDSSSIILDINGISKEIVLIMQGTIVLSVVVVYELVRRYGVAPSNDGSAASSPTSIPRRRRR